MGSSKFGGDTPGSFGLPPGGNPPYIDDMDGIAILDRRVSVLETDVRDIKTLLQHQILPLLQRIDRRLDGVETRLGKVEVDIAKIDGRITGVEGQLRQVPTLWAMGGTMLAINAGIVSVAALIIAGVRFLL